MMTIDQIYPMLTEAILRAETYEDLGLPNVRWAYQQVSQLEEKVAELLPASNSQGALARRGAVRAALSAKDLPRAQQLAARFLAETGLGEESCAEIRRIVREAEGAAVARFPKVAAFFGFSELERRFRAWSLQPAPFPVG